LKRRIGVLQKGVELLEKLFLPQVNEVMTTSLVTIQAGSSVTDAVQKMICENAESIIVIEDGHPVGIFTRQDLMNRIIEGGLDVGVTSIDQVMSSPIVNVDCNDLISSAMGKMEQSGISRLIVLHKDHMAGILTMEDIRLKYSRGYQSSSLLVRKFFVDTIAYVTFWSGISFIINVLIVGIEFDKFVTSSAIGFALSLVLGGPFGRYLDIIRAKARV
jgi:signal-transduction protein with cAMP-binding, CBS, and nucleotidyltransferase domain